MHYSWIRAISIGVAWIRCVIDGSERVNSSDSETESNVTEKLEIRGRGRGWEMIAVAVTERIKLMDGKEGDDSLHQPNHA